MLSGAMCRAAAIVGTAVFRMVVSSDSMKNATATSQGSSLFTSVRLISLARDARGVPPVARPSTAWSGLSAALATWTAAMPEPG
jgi:hypothetical protein